MRILMTTDTVGGVWNFTCTLTEQLLNRGHTVHLVSFGRTPSPEQMSWAARFASFPNTVISTEGEAERPLYPASGASKTPFAYTPTDLPLEWMQTNDQALLAGATLLNNLIHQQRPDLLLANQFCFGALATDLPKVVVAHSDVLSWAQACRGEALAPSPWLARYTAMVTAGLRAATAVVAPTFTMATALVNHFPVPHGVEVIANGAQVTPLADQPQRKLQAITAGRLWDEGKGLDILQNLQAPMPILLAGDDTFETASAHTTSTNLGLLSQTKLHRYFSESALYLCTSRYEPFGLAPLEAALCGCALVLRDIPSLREVWQDNALYFNDQASLRHTLEHLAASPETLADLQSRAQTRAREFTPERMTDNYLSLFDSILKRQKGLAHVA